MRDDPGTRRPAADADPGSGAGPAPAGAGDPLRAGLLRRGFVLEYITLGWNVAGI